MNKFLNEVASATPTPGGGAVNALVGSLAASLAQMVANLTTGRRKYKHVDEEVSDILNKIVPIRDQLMQAIEDDAVVYQRVITLLQHRTNENETTMLKAMEDALIGAAQVPLRVARLSRDVAIHCQRLVEIGNEHAVADAAVGMLMAQAAIRGSALNVKANLAQVEDTKLRKRWVNEVGRIEKEITELVEAVLEKANSRIAGEDRTSARRRRRRKE